ncbi:type I restriction enzyme endonuclease domain-containing protein [Luteimonas chenhongjianii]|uniref:type I restriction enzyme endonuclease domain-containing protein n=1 Tax=Luteimonas chenhongjianii TaxID=2006110 RepID=UPI0012FD5ACB|nr:type I restriction enzyme endonuclease domain-containing protein [Luteimonas chenhongjianii]
MNDIYSTLGLDKPHISLLDEDFLAQIRGMPTQNLAAELLERLLADQIRQRGQKSALQGKEFAERLEEAVNRYRNRRLTTVEVIEELIRLAKELNEARPPDGITGRSSSIPGAGGERICRTRARPPNAGGAGPRADQQAA